MFLPPIAVVRFSPNDESRRRADEYSNDQEAVKRAFAGKVEKKKKEDSRETSSLLIRYRGVACTSSFSARTYFTRTPSFGLDENKEDAEERRVALS